MAFNHKLMYRFTFSQIYQQTKAFSALLYLSQHHSMLNLHARSYRRPGTSIEKITFWKRSDFNFKKGVEYLKTNTKLMFKEMRNRFIGPGGRSMKEAMMEQTTVLFDFRCPEDLQKWCVSTDMEIGGKSQAFLKQGRNNQTALFYGILNSQVPRDGETTSSGYCTLRSKPLKASFDRKLNFDCSNFNTLHLRIRGDGRPWMVNIQTETYFTLQSDDLYNYFMYTRGGPYWQDVKIPLSKFFMSSRGRIQDGQYPLSSDRIRTVGFTLADRANGPFHLEIDFVGMCLDFAHTEECAYELTNDVPL